MNRNIYRRIERLEANPRWASNQLSFLIQFVDPKKGLTSTLLLEGSKRVWTNLEEQDASSPEMPDMT